MLIMLQLYLCYPDKFAQFLATYYNKQWYITLQNLYLYCSDYYGIITSHSDCNNLCLSFKIIYAIRSYSFLKFPSSIANKINQLVLKT